MYEISRCRTCLKNSTKAFPLSKHAIGIDPKATYGQLLKEYARLEFPSDYERLMPQYLCILCCSKLSNAYNFMRQAQYCNNKLINVISKKLSSLQEKPIILTQHGLKLEKPPNIKMEKDCDTIINHNLQHSSTINEFRIVNPSVILKSEVLEESTENEGKFKYYIEDIDEIENNENEQNKGSNLEFSATTGDSHELPKKLNDNDEETLEYHTDIICPICKKIINKHDNLITHIRIKHDIKIPNILSNKMQKSETQRKLIFICKICNNQFIHKTAYQNHLKDKHTKDKRNPKNKIIKCLSCDYTARTYAALNFHKRSKHGTDDDKFKCIFCSYTSLKKFSLLMHVKNSHKELIKSLKANVQNNSELGDSSNDNSIFETTQENIKSISENEVNSCSDEKSPLSKKSLSCMNNDTEADNEELTDEMFIRNILNIKKRQSNAIPIRLLPRLCDECGNIYKNLRALKTHQKNVHIGEDKYFSCPYCGKKLKCKANLRYHIRNAHGPKKPSDIVRPTTAPKPKEKRFMCTECSYVCSAITTLKIHINRHHTGEKPYTCEVCFKSFIVPFDLKIHRYLHTGERPYKCPICSKGFRCNYHMIKHKRIHNNERPYKCKDCDKSFIQSYNLSLHKRIHLKEKKLNCKICDKLFENQTLLNIHCINENHHDEVE